MSMHRTLSKRQANHHQAREQFRREVFLAALPALIGRTGWLMPDGTSMTTMAQRIEQAHVAADIATDQFFSRGLT